MLFFFLCSFQNIHNAAIKVVSVTASLLQYACLSVVSLFVCLSLSSALVVGGPGRPSLLKEHKGDCCGSSCSGVQRLSVFVFVSVCVCVCTVSWPCRADRPSSHGAGSSCVLCCRSGNLSHWSVVGTVSRRKQQQQKSSFSISFLSIIHFSALSLFPISLIHNPPFLSP